MKKSLALLIIGLMISSNCIAEAHYCHSHYYVTYKDYYQEEYTFPNCDKHSMLSETNVYYYSNGTRRSYTTCTIFNHDGSILESGCSNVKHYIFNNKHYFTFYKNKKYQIMDEYGNYLSVKKYKYMQEIAPNRLLIKLDKKFGIVTLNDETIVTPKYKKFEQIGENLFLTKLNGYYGMIDSSNNILIKHEHDKITKLYDTFIIKKYDKFGLVNLKGEQILPTEYDSIKKLGEYIIVKKNKRYGVFDASGNMIVQPVYKKIRLERNNLEGKISGNSWQNLL